MLLSVANVAKAFGADSILTGISFRLAAREKVALVGRNGTGKTTLLKIITGQMEPDSGSVQVARGAKIGYLRQEDAVTPGVTVLQEAELALQHQMQLRTRLQELEAKLETSRDPADAEEYALLHEHFLEAEGYSLDRDLRTVLQRMGFTEHEFDRPTDALSGGERTRLALARLLLEEPDLLILDEPTNHLDLQATEWLEGWLKGYHGAVLLVSHDRTFLENTADKVLELRDGQVKAYAGPFDKYLKLKAEEDARLAEVAKRQEHEIAKMDEYVRRFMNSQRTAQARGRLKHLNRLIESRVHAPKAEKGMKAGFKAAGRSGDQALVLEGASVGYPSLTLIKDLDWTVRYGERWGVIGENGAGKSTLIRVALGLQEPLAGRARLGSKVTAGYFSQDADDLDPLQSPLDMLVWDCDMLPADARNLLARFLITGDDVYRPIKTLSGGEKNKLSLARLTRLNPNLLVMDEPTNHLDMDSREALADVLREFEGTLILVSHDRWLLSAVTSHTLDVRRNGVIQYPGSYAEYRRWITRTASKPAQAPALDQAATRPTMTPRELSKEIQRTEKLIEQIERLVAQREKELRELEAQLSNPDGADVVLLSKNHHQVQVALGESLRTWEQESNRLEELKGRQGEGGESIKY